MSDWMRAYLDNSLQTPRRMVSLQCRGPSSGCTVEGVRRPPLSRAQGPQRGAHGATALRGREGEGRCRPPAANLGPAGHARAPGQGPAARGSPAGVSRPIRSLPLHAQRGAHGATAVRGRGWEGRCRPAAASSEAQVPAPRASTAACKGRYDTVSEPGLLCSKAARKGRYDTVPSAGSGTSPGLLWSTADRRGQYDTVSEAGICFRVVKRSTSEGAMRTGTAYG